MSCQSGIRVLHVDDDPDFTELTAEMLERENDQFTVETASTADDGLETLTTDIDCIVSDYDVSHMDGIEFLEAVRDEYPELPFIMFTDKGSEEIASAAISAGVTDYLQKRPDADQYSVLADRIVNAVDQEGGGRTLEDQRQRFQLLFEQLTEPAVEVKYEADQPIVQQVNPAFEDVFGYDASEIVGDSLDAYIVPDGKADEAARINQRVQADGQLDAEEVRRRTADGEREFLIQSALYGDGSGGFGIYTDITARKNRERELEKYRTLVETVGDPMYMLDADGNITMVNDAVVERWGYAKDELTEMHASEIMPDEDYERATALIRELLSDSERTWDTFEMRSLAADGTTLINETMVGVITDDGEYVGSAGVIRDISDRKERERKLEQSQKRYRSLFENNPLVIWEEDFSTAKESLDALAREVADIEAFLCENPEELDRFLQQLDIIDVNRNALEYYNAPSKDSLIENIEQIFTQEAREMFASLLDTFAAGETRFRSETVSQTFDGQRKHEVLEAFVPDEYADDYSRVYITVIDITKRKEQKRELQRKNERLDEFAGVVSHDLQNPLTTLEGSLELAAKTGDDEHFERCHRAVDRMSRLIEDLLTLAREGERIEEMSSIPLQEVSTESWETVGRSEATLSVETDQVIQADQSRLRQLLENLFTNAVEHGGEDVIVRVGDLDDGNGFYVADDGPGIPKEKRDRVFESGYSTTDDGTGFGLKIVQEIAEAHNWGIRVTASEDDGARFEITGVGTESRYP